MLGTLHQMKYHYLFFIVLYFLMTQLQLVSSLSQERILIAQLNQLRVETSFIILYIWLMKEDWMLLFNVLLIIMLISTHRYFNYHYNFLLLLLLLLIITGF